MEVILDYVSIITLAGAAISFAVGLIKWIDQRNREQEQKQFEAFHKMVCIASGVDETGRTVKMVQQIAAVYQLQAYKQYAFASVPILELMKFEFDNKPSDKRAEFLYEALNKTLDVLIAFSEPE